MSDMYFCLRHAARRGGFGSAAGLLVSTAVLLVSLAGCHASSPRTASPDRAPPAASPVPTDASYDWHGLLVAPFGSVLKEIPLTLHEVLLFRDEAHGASAADEAECYAADASPPRFVGRTPQEYLLCFKQDRMSRVQASVRLSAAEAPEVFATACARWSKQTTPASPSPTSPTVSPAAASATAMSPTAVSAGTSAADQAVGACEGRDGGIHFSGHLETESTHQESPAGEQVLSITLDGPPAP